jgi:hypothetical protein
VPQEFQTLRRRNSFGLEKNNLRISGFAVFLNNAVVVARSKMQQCVTFLVTEGELVAAALCVQEMLYVKHVLELINLKVTMPNKHG